MKQLLILFSIILFASCEKETYQTQSTPIVGHVDFSVDRIKLPTQVVVISIDNISAGAIIADDHLTVQTNDTLTHTYQVVLFDSVLLNDTIAGQFKARDRQTVKVIVANE